MNANRPARAKRLLRIGVPGTSRFRLDGLIRHALEPDEKQWFARCRIDFIKALPTFQLEAIRLAVVMATVGLVAPLPRAMAIANVVLLLAGGAWCAHQKRQRPDDSLRGLRNIGLVAGGRSLLWACTLNSALQAVPEPPVALLGFGMMMLAIDGLCLMTMPLLAYYGTISSAIAIGEALVLRGAPEAPLIIAMLAAGVLFMQFAIYNFYYVFATRRIRTRRLGQSNETVQLLLNQYDAEGSDWLYQTDAQGEITAPSSRFCKACGLLPEVLDGLPFDALFHASSQLDDLRAHLAREAPFRGLAVPLRVDEEERWWSLNGRPIRDGQGRFTGWRGFIADISAARRAEAQVSRMAHYDQLTGLANRAMFKTTVDRALARRRGTEVIALLYIDLDQFKAINDSHGHAAGDVVLTEMARRLEAAVRPLDLVARLGGDEFVVMLPQLDAPEDALRVARRIVEGCLFPVDGGGVLLPLGASIGVALAPLDATVAEDLLRAADLAMYDAKTRGRNLVSVFDPGMQAQMRERRALELDLRLAAGRGEFELHYQPVCATDTGQIVGYEALLRWNHPTRGLILPGEFVGIAEESGLIVEIGAWVLRTALAEAAGWPDEIALAVNLSPAQMRDAAVVGLVVGALAQSGVAPARLELEITETLLIQDCEKVLAILHRLREVGVRIALDDFGTGYSSLNYLRSFPFDKIKIDRCFVSELPDRPDCQAIVRSVLRLARELDMVTTAEGVENEEQRCILAEQGCEQVQGYLISRPVPAAELTHSTPAATLRATG